MPYLISAASEFVAQTPFSIDEEDFKQNVILFASNPDAVIFTTGSSHCAAVISSSLYKSDEFICRIVSTWGKGGMRCFDAVERWAKGRGAKFLIADSYLEPRITKLYKRRGMKGTDQLFMKAI